MKQLLVGILVAVSLIVPNLVGERAYAGLFDGSSQVACDGIQLDDSGSADCSEEPTKINSALELAINLFSLVVGVVAVIMLIIGGLKYVTSNGDSGAVSSAKNTIIYAVVGLVVVVLAQAIVSFTVNRVSTDEAAQEEAAQFERDCADARPGQPC